ncbi:MAG TPA: alpha/beta hydrolase-fold protein [Steroidobacteraceae bacterium]
MKLRSALITFPPMLMLGISALCHAAQPADDSHPIVIGERFQLQSQATGETRSYFVHRPEDYDLSSARYPLLVVLDADGDFQHASTTADLLAESGRIPQMLVVGIPNTVRNRDLIPFAAGSGSEKFLKFITTELIPKLDHDFRTQPHRILVGHSFGGLFALYSLIKAPGVFKGYILASPTLERENRGLARTVGLFLEEHKEVTANVYLTTANETGEFLSGNWELSGYFQNRVASDPRWTFAFRRYPEETHGSIALRSVYDGLEFLFDGWPGANSGPDAFALYEHGGLAAIDKYYADLSSRLGFPVAVPEGVLLAPAFQLYRQKRVAEAEQVILHTLELHPNYVSALLTAGRLYFDKGDRARATQYLTKALLLAPRSRALGVDYAALNLDPQKVLPAVELSAGDLQKCVGAYGLSAPAMQIARRGGKLFAIIADQEDELTALSDTRFYYTNGDEVVTFDRDARGRVVGLELQNHGVKLLRLK